MKVLTITLCLIFVTGVSAASEFAMPVSARPGLFDSKTGVTKTTGMTIPIKPAGVDNIQQILGTASGTGKVLVILIDFTDQQASASHTSANYDNMLFPTGTYPTGSLNDYFIENSYGTFSVSGHVTGWYRAPQPYSYYTGDSQGFGPYPNNAQKLAEHAVALADPDVDFSQFDGDGDGFVDALFIVHAGPGAEETFRAHDIWSHAWCTGSPLSVDGVLVSSYSMEPEEHDDGNIISIGVFCHEFGHILGLPDLYDCDYSSDGIGQFGLMGSGSWGGDGHSPQRPVHLCAWSKMKLGWISPVRITSDGFGVTIPCYEITPTAFRLWTNGNDGKEYFLVVNRQKTGFDSTLPRNGLLIWHIDETVSHNNDEQHKMVDLEEADGLAQLDVYGDFNRGDGGDFYPGLKDRRAFHGSSAPNSKRFNGSTSGVTVGGISDPTMSTKADLLVSGSTYPDIYLPVTFHEFGTVALHTTVSRTFNVKNVGEAPLTIQSIASEYNEYSILLFSLPAMIQAGQSMVVTVLFMPMTPDTFEATLIIQCDDADHPEMHISLYGIGAEGCQGDIGDVNGDASINVLDVLAAVNDILQVVTLDEFGLCRADCNEDGGINVLDALNIVNVILGIILECPGGNAKTIVTEETIAFLEALRPHFPVDRFEEFMSLVKEIQVPETFSLCQNYPNPFNPETTIEYTLPEPTRVKMEVYNLLGQGVDVLVDSEMDVGFHTVTWNVWNGVDVSSGVYFYRLTAGEYSETKRMVLMR